MFGLLLAAVACRWCSALLVVVTGATGELGRALVQQARALSPPSSFSSSSPQELTLVLGCRDESRLSLSPPFPPGCFPLPLGDLSDLSSIPSTSALIASFAATSSRVVLINAAGVCLSGLDSSILSQSVAVNSLYPVLLATALHHRLHSAAALQVINVSSGDGQLCYLDSALAASVSALDSIDAWERFCREIQPPAPTALGGGGELAFSPGGTPAYSVSKALLTKGSALLQREWDKPEQTPPPPTTTRTKTRSSSSGGGGGILRRQALCLCPGDFLSPMSSASERVSPLLRTAAEAADDVWHMVFFADAYEGGGYYHLREPAEL